MSRNRQLFKRFIFSFFLFFGFCKHSVRCSTFEKKLPNILFILVDDLRPALGTYGDSVAKSPYIDRLASKGIRFDMAYANQAVCAPSRFNLMLGSRSTSTGIYDFGQNFREYYPEALTLPQFFKQQGYHTEAMGKVYHIGHGTFQDEESWSVPHYPDLLIEYVDSVSKKQGLTREEALFSNLNPQGLPRGLAWESPNVEDEAYADGRIALRAIQRLSQFKKKQLNNTAKPFFLAIGFARPHLPFSVPRKYWDRYDLNKLPLPKYQKKPLGAPSFAVKRDTEIDQYSPIPHSSEKDPFPEWLQQKLIHGYYASVSYVDEQIGKVITALEELELDNNTIVVLWGDHGFHLGELGIWTKHVNYELANKIPLIISAPWYITQNTCTSQLTETVDIYPTLVELSGFELPEVSQPFDGMSMLQVLNSPDLQIRDHAYHAFPRGGKLGRAIRTHQYRMVEWKKIGEPDDTAEYELYDYRDGNVEKKNIALDRPDVLGKMKYILKKHPVAYPKR